MEDKNFVKEGIAKKVVMSDFINDFIRLWQKRKQQKRR
jgi:hypothetical protein